MHLKNLGNSLDAINDIQKVFTHFNSIPDGLGKQKNLMESLEKTTKDYSTEVLKLATSQVTLTEKQATAIFTAKGLSGAELDAAVKTATLSASQKDATASTLGLGAATKGLWMTMKAHPIMVVTAAVSLAVGAYSKWKQSQEENRQATQDAARTYAETSKSIEDYTKRYEDLHKALLDAKGNEEETYNVKKQLLDLQSELNDKYDDEYDKVNLVTDAYKDQTETIKSLNREAAQKYLNENEAGIRTATQKMTEVNPYRLSHTNMVGNSDEGKALIAIVKKYQDAGMSLHDDLGNGDYANFTIDLNANAEDAYKTINDFASDVRAKAKELGNEHIYDDVLQVSSDELKRAKSTIDKQGEQYYEALRKQIILDDNLAPQYEQAIQAVKDYNDAVLKSANPFEDEKVFSAYNHLNEVKAGIQENESEWSKYSTVINDVFDQADTKSVDFAQKIKNNDLSLGSIVKDIKKLDLSDVDLKIALDDAASGTVFESLTKRAEHYGVTIDELVSLLTRLGVVQNSFSKDQEQSVIKTKEEMISSINGLSEGFESLDKIMSSMKGKNPFDYALLDDKKFKDTFSSVGKEYTDFVEQISSSPKDIQACKGAFDNLVTAWLNSQDILDRLSDDTSDLTINMLYNMGVANAEEIVTAALAEKHAQLAAQKIYDANATKVLTNNTMDEYSSLLNECEASEITKQALARLEISKIAVNDVNLDTADDIDQLLNLAAVAGATANTLQRLQWAKSVYARVDSGELAPDSILVTAAGDAVDRALNADYNAYKPEFNPVDYSGGNKTNAAGGSSKDSSKEPTEFDWMERKISLIDSQVDRLRDKIDILVGYKGKNAVADTAIDRLIEKMNTLQQMHDRYMEEAGKMGLSQDYIDKIQNGTIEIETIGDENLVKAIQDYQDLYDKAQSANDRILDTQKSIHELNISKLDNIVNQFEKVLDIQSQIVDTEKQLLDLREKAGEEIFADDYISLAGKQLNLVRENTKSYKALSEEMAKLNLEKGSDEWKTYNDQLQDYKNNMISAASAVEDYKDAMVDLVYKGLRDFKSAMDSINGTISTMNNLIGDTNLVDESGMLTDRGLAQIALYAQQMANAKQEAAEYAEAIQSLDDALDSGLITQDEYNSMMYEYTSAQESAIQASKDAKDAILSLVKEGIQAEIDAKKKLIDETKAELEAEQELHDYQNSIAEKQDGISKLERQIAALSNSTNRDDIAKRLQLQSELAEAQKELYETQYDHEMDQRKEALDKEYDAYEESKQKEMDELDSNLDSQNAAINKYLDKVKNNYNTVYDVLKQYGDEYSLSAIESLTTPWESGSNAADLFNEVVGNAVSNIQYEIDGLDFSPLYELVDLLSELGVSHDGLGFGSSEYDDISNQGKWQKGKDGKDWFGEDYNPNGDYFFADDGIYTINGKQYGFDDQGYMISGWSDRFGEWRYFEPENGQMVRSTWRKDSNGQWYYLDKDGLMARDMAVKGKDSDEYYYLDKDGKYNGEPLTAEQVRKLGYTIGYKKGTKRISHDQLAWTQEDKPELITRPSDGALLTPLKQGDGVINGDLTQNLLDIANDPYKFVADYVANSTPNYKMIEDLVAQAMPVFDIPEYAVQPVVKEQKVEVNMNIGGVLDEAAARVLSNEFPSMIKKHQQQIGAAAYKDMEKKLLGK